MAQDETTQLELFRQAVQLLGGQTATARALDMNERTVRALVSDPDSKNHRNLHDGILEDMAKALLARAELCRSLERKLSPAFLQNRTERQISGKANQGRHVRVKDPASICQACGRTAARGHAPGCANAREPWPTIEAELAGDEA